jgi:hypothetical protein
VLDPLAESYQISANGATVLDVLARRLPSSVRTAGRPAWEPRANGLAAQLSVALRGFNNELMDSASSPRFEERPRCRASAQARYRSARS